MSIHPLAAVSPAAKIGRDVRIGPFSIVESDVTIGDGCILESHAIVKDGTTLGAGNHIYEGAVLGGFPQHAHMPECPGKVLIGSGNTIRENVTVHRAMETAGVTIIGNNNLLMVNVHLAHDCRLGDNTVIVPNSILGGHVTVDDRAYISGGVAVHQFVRIGSLAMVGGQAHLSKDVPPFVTVDGLSSLVVGVNQIGLRRAGFDREAIRQLKAAYRVIYRSGLAWTEMLGQLKLQFPDGPAAAFHQFLSTTKRGMISERRMPPGATIKLHRPTEERPQLRAKAG